jgi:hypothetical protein
MHTHRLIRYNTDISAIQETTLQSQHIIETKNTTFIVGDWRENMNMEWHLLWREEEYIMFLISKLQVKGNVQ